MQDDTVTFEKKTRLIFSKVDLSSLHIHEVPPLQ